MLSTCDATVTADVSSTFVAAPCAASASRTTFAELTTGFATTIPAIALIPSAIESSTVTLRPHPIVSVTRQTTAAATAATTAAALSRLNTAKFCPVCLHAGLGW